MGLVKFDRETPSVSSNIFDFQVSDREKFQKIVGSRNMTKVNVVNGDRVEPWFAESSSVLRITIGKKPSRD